MTKNASSFWLGIGTMLALSIAFFVVYVFPPTEYNFYPKCLLYQWTGLHCPGCGGTRAVHHLVHFRFPEALSMNALSVLLLPWLFLTLVLQKMRDPKKHFLDLTISSRLGWTLACIVIGFGMMRNIPIPPFSFLAPKQEKKSTLFQVLEITNQKVLDRESQFAKAAFRRWSIKAPGPYDTISLPNC